jgi:transposase-like protein
MLKYVTLLAIRGAKTSSYLGNAGYTTNALDSRNRELRKPVKTKGSFPTEEAATKLILLAIRNFEKSGRNVREWVAARNQLAVMFAGHFDARMYLKIA